MAAFRKDRAQWRPLAALTVAVLAMHLVLLRASPGGIALRDPLSATAFMTRTIESPPTPAPTPAPPPPETQPQPAPTPPAPEAAKPPVPKEKVVPAPAPPPPPATNSVANEAPLSLPVGPAAETPIALNPGFTIGPTPPPGATPTLAAEAARERLPQPSAFTVPGSVRLRYQVAAFTRGMDLKAKADLLWRQDGSTYEARLELAMPFLPARVQQSTGRITAGGLEPLRFSDRARSEEAAHFERDKGRLSFSANRPEAPLLSGAQDRLSVLLQLGAMVAGDPSKYPPATTITVQTASAREAELWLFTVEGEEDLSLPGGRMKALKLMRNPRKEFDQKVELWLAPAWDYVPVRVRLTQSNGDRYDLQWLSTDKP